MLQLVLLLIIWPIAEIYLLVQIGRAAGALTALAIVILAGVAGAALAKHEGFKTYQRIRSELAAGRVPSDDVVDALIILAAGVLLILPGLISDVIAIALLIPPIRRRFREHLKRRFRSRFTIMQFGPGGPRRSDDEFVDVEVREIGRKQLDSERPDGNEGGGKKDKG